MKHGISTLRAACLALLLLLPAVASAADGDWSGTWTTRWRDGGAALELHQDGAKVTGTYPLYGGRVEGEIVGRELRGRWFEGASRFGGFVFVLAPDGRSFMGRYDTGEWWTGERAKRSSFSTQVDQATPRRAFRTFLLAGTGWREGVVDEIGKAVAVLDFGPSGSAMRPGQKIEAAIDLFQAVSQTTFRIWDVPGRSAQEAEVRLSLEQAGTGVALPLLIRREEERWYVVVPPADQLARHTAALFARSGGRLPPPDAHLALRTPRAAMQTFLQAFRDWDGAGPQQAVNTLDLSGVRPSLREHEGRLAAEYLKNVLARIGWVTLPEIPDDPQDRTPYVHFRHGAGNIVIAPQGEGADTRWRFTEETVRDLRALYAALEDMPTEEQARPPAVTSSYFALRERLRAHAPWLLGRWGAVENWQVAGAAALVVLAALAAVLVSLVVRLGERVARRQGRLHRRHLLWPANAALACGILLVGAAVLGLPNAVLQVLYAVVGCVLALSAVWAGWHLIDLVRNALLPRLQRTLTSLDDILLSLVTTAAKVALVASGAVYVADALAIPYSGVVAGLGIGGLAVAFASKETLSNVFGAAILAADRPFRRGDWIQAGATQGTVEHVGIRSTRIRTAEDSVVVVPNGKLADETINNLGTRRTRLFKVVLPLSYAEDAGRLDTLAADIRALLDGTEGVMKDKVQVGLMTLRDCSVDLDITCYLDVRTAAEERQLRHDLILALIGLCRRDGVTAAPTAPALAAA